MALQRRASAALVQAEVSAKNSIRDLVDRGLDRAARHEAQLDALWDDALKQLVDENGCLRQMVTDDGMVRFDMLEQLLHLSKARVDARGGGSLKWAELGGKLSGELQTGTRVQINLLVPHVERACESWSVQELPVVIRRALEEDVGIDGEALENVMAAIGRRIAEAQGGLRDHVVRVLEARNESGGER